MAVRNDDPKPATGVQIPGEPAERLATMDRSTSTGCRARNGAEKTLNLTVGATTVFNKQPLQKAPTFALQHPTLVVGAVVKNINDPSSPECKVHVDDILFDVRPL